MARTQKPENTASARRRSAGDYPRRKNVLNIGFIDPILNESDKAAAVVKDLGNVTNSKIINTDTTEYIGVVEGETNNSQDTVDDLGNVYTT